MTAPLNILWFTTDQQRFDTIGALGNPHVSTPVIDNLVRCGTTFSHAFCQSPICTPSRSSFMTGMYPSAIRANRNGNAAFSDAAPLVTRLFADAGYLCGNVGKLHLANAFTGIETRVDDGYSVFNYSLVPRPHGGYDYGDWVKAQGFNLAELVASAEGIPSKLHQTTWCADRAIEFLDLNGHRPFVLTVNPFDPHPPFDAPLIYRDQFDPGQMPGPHYRDTDLVAQAALAAVDFQTRPRPPERAQANDGPSVYSSGGALNLNEDVRHLQANYYAMIKLIDDQFGRILRHLESLGLTQNTLVIFASDHGEMLGDHGLLLKGARFYEGLVRVPLIFSCPTRLREDVISPALVELIDIAPTLLEMAGLPVPENMQGKSLVPILRGEASPDDHRVFVRCEYFDALALEDASMATMFRTERYKLVRYHNHALGELFDLAQDPWEHENLWDSADHVAIRQDLVERSFDAAMRCMDTGPARVARW